MTNHDNLMEAPPPECFETPDETLQSMSIRYKRAVPEETLDNVIAAVSRGLGAMHESGMCHHCLAPDRIYYISNKFRISYADRGRDLEGFSKFLFQPPEEKVRWDAKTDFWLLGVTILSCCGVLQGSLSNGNLSMNLDRRILIADITGRGYTKNFAKTVSNLLIHRAFLGENTSPEKLLFASVSNADLKSVEKALMFGANVNVKNENNSTPLMFAVSSKNEELTMFLLRNKASTSAREASGMTPFLIAARNEWENGLVILKAAGCNVDEQDAGGWSALMSAARQNNVLTASTLLHIGTDPSLVTKGGWTALLIACQEGSTEVVRILLSRAASHVGERNICTGRTALMMAAQSGHADVLRLLHEYKASPNIVDKDGWTALLIAVLHEQANAVLILLTVCGADPSQFNGVATPLVAAIETGSLDITRLLLQAGADPYQVSPCTGMTALMTCTKLNQPAIAQCMLNEFNIAAHSANLRSAVDVARKLDYPEMVQVLSCS
eukprot:TRINITY_DN8454_c0_g1_i1.p1 TRINITY_DN8454_c0_g1~~TRINITY_DN8454_c0_g1_i1.p1  ORF type:complete len:496 (+),score=46.52 TRINITY_DN8454_c0_g1_i1:80-1567(+)